MNKSKPGLTSGLLEVIVAWIVSLLVWLLIDSDSLIFHGVKFETILQNNYVIVITWARGIRLIYMPKPEGHRSKGAGIYIRQIPRAHVISSIYVPLLALDKNLPKLTGNCSAVTVYIVTDAECDSGMLF